MGITSSPRPNSNSEALLDEVLEGAREAGAHVEKVNLKHLRVAPCIACDGCFLKGRCVVQDDYQTLYEKFLVIDRVAFATPVYFMNISAQLKMVFDRCQCFWAKKYVLKEPLFPEPPPVQRKGMVIAVSGSGLVKWFDVIHLTMRYVFDVLAMEYADDFFVTRMDRRGEALKKSDLLLQARRKGKTLGTA